MSTGVSDHQRNKGQGNSKPYNKFPNGPKDHHGAEQEDVDSWRNQQQQQQQQQQHQGNAYMTGAASADPYMQSYYGQQQSFQYANYGVNESGPWANNGGGDPFIGGGGGGYASGGMHESAGAPGGPYDNGMFGNGGGSYGNFGGGQPGHGFGYGGFHGNGGDYNTWGQPRKPYDDYYRDGYGDKMMERAMGGLSLGNEREESGGGGKSKSWANIASQPAKAPSNMKKKAGMPHPPIIPGNWDNKNGSVPKAPMVAPVQAPHPPAWERQKPAPPPSGPPPQQPPPQNMGPGPGFPPGPPSGGPGNRNQPYHQRGPPPSYNNSQQHAPPSAMMPPQANSHEGPRAPVVIRNAEPATRIVDPPPKIKDPDDIKIKNNYNPAEFDLSPEGARFFVIKSYSEDDIHRSIKYEIWCSTDRGNHTLDQAFREREGKGPVFLFFSVNGSGHFCGIAQMMSAVDYNASSSVWCQDKWKGQFKVKWVYVKDVANSALRQIRLENNENKPVTNSRDTQEVPYEKGKQVLKIIHTYAHTTSIFDDFIHYEERQKEEDERRSAQQTSPPIVQQDRPVYDRGGRGGHHHQPYNERGGTNQNYHQNPRGDRDFGFRGGPDREGHGRREMNDRGGPDREHFNRGYDRGDYQRDHRGGRGGGRGMPRQ